MSRPALATLNDLEALTGAIDNDDAITRALSLLSMASEVVRSYAGVTWLNGDETDVVNVPGQIPDVVAGMVERATSNPLGVTQESAGPFSRSFGADASQRLYLSANERMVIRSAVGRASIATLPTTRGPLETPDVRCGDDGYGPPGLIEASDPFSL